MTLTGLAWIIVGSLVLLSKWKSPRLFRIFVLIISFLLGAAAVVLLNWSLWDLEAPVLALPVLSLTTLAGFLLILKRRVFVCWIIATIYVILVLPMPEASPLLLGVPGGALAWFGAQRVIDTIRNRTTKTK
jgi:small-conductance mechanosensitive channel